MKISQNITVQPGVQLTPLSDEELEASRVSYQQDMRGGPAGREQGPDSNPGVCHQAPVPLATLPAYLPKSSYLYSLITAFSFSFVLQNAFWRAETLKVT